jgi:hypothetical protein
VTFEQNLHLTDFTVAAKALAACWCVGLHNDALPSRRQLVTLSIRKVQ